MKFLNSNNKPKPPKDKAVIKQEKLKHDQNKRASEKRGLPRFDMEMAKKLLEGRFHEEEEEEVEAGSNPAKTMLIANNAEMQH